MQCSELHAAETADSSGEAAHLLEYASVTFGLCDSRYAERQIGDSTAQVWDAVNVAARVTTAGPGAAVRYGGASGSWTVRDGRVVERRPLASGPLCVLTLDLSDTSGRSMANCSKAFAER